MRTAGDSGASAVADLCLTPAVADDAHVRRLRMEG
jgi:hypothetical protein